MVQQAESATDAESMLRELICLHTRRWQRVGARGGFASAVRQRFHLAFVRRAVPLGNAQLLRITAGSKVIGLLYNLVANGRVNFYQSGLNYEGERNLRPGMVAHHLAITHCMERGHLEYDFLASDPGKERYKRSLSNASRSLGWVTLYRPGWRQVYFDQARAVRDLAASLIAARWPSRSRSLAKD
jgi:CelD/BcsL family acetyltransferase involved in cellulose biosynthesis